jgi:hypothetical protein
MAIRRARADDSGAEAGGGGAGAAGAAAGGSSQHVAHQSAAEEAFSPRSLVCGGQTSPHRPRLVVSRSTCPPLSPSRGPDAHSFIIGTAIINNNAG